MDERIKLSCLISNIAPPIHRLVHGNGIPMGIPWETSRGMGQASIAMGWEWDR